MTVPAVRATYIDRTSLRKIGVGLAAAALLLLLPTPEGLSTEGRNTLVLFALVVYLWATEALPLPVTALAAGVGLVLLQVAQEPNDAWGPYASDTIFFILGSLILADGVAKSGIDHIIAGAFMRRFGTTTDGMLMAIVVATAIPAMFVSDHAVAAVMLTVVVSMLRTTGLIEERRIAAAFVLAIAFGANIAGLATPSGGARNAVILGYLNQLYDVRVSYLDWAIRAVPVTLALIPFVYIVLKLVFRVPHRRLDISKIPATGFHLDRSQRFTAAILVLTVVLWATMGEHLGLGTIAVLGAVLLFVVGVLDWVDTRRRVAWGVPLIYGAALSLGAAMQESGAASWLATSVLNIDVLSGPTLLFLAALVLTVLLTNFMSDGGTAAVVAPVTLAVASLAGLSVADMGMVTAIGSAFSFILVVGTPPNVIAFSSGLFTARDLAKAGSLLTVLALGVTMLALVFYWPML